MLIQTTFALYLAFRMSERRIYCKKDRCNLTLDTKLSPKIKIQTEVHVWPMTVHAIKDIVAGIEMNLHCFPGVGAWEQRVQCIYIISLEGQ